MNPESIFIKTDGESVLESCQQLNLCLDASLKEYLHFRLHKLGGFRLRGSHGRWGYASASALAMLRDSVQFLLSKALTSSRPVGLGQPVPVQFSAPEQAVFYVKSAKLDMFILQRGSVLSGQRRCRILAAMVAWRQKGIENKG